MTERTFTQFGTSAAFDIVGSVGESQTGSTGLMNTIFVRLVRDNENNK